MNIQIGLDWIGSAKMGPCPTLSGPPKKFGQESAGVHVMILKSLATTRLVFVLFGGEIGVYKFVGREGRNCIAPRTNSGVA